MKCSVKFCRDEAQVKVLEEWLCWFHWEKHCQSKVDARDSMTVLPLGGQGDEIK